MTRTTRTLACLATLAGTSLLGVNAHALFLFGPKKFELWCVLSNEHPGAGAIGKDLPKQQLSPQGAASVAGRIDLVSRGQVLAKGVVARVSVTKAAQADRYNMAASFTRATGQSIHKGTSVIQPGYWSAITYQDWPRSQAYLSVKCLVQRAR